MLLYLNLDPYLAQWFINDHGGTIPVKLKRGSVESCIIEQFITLPPSDYKPMNEGESNVQIEIPCFKSKDTRYNFFLPPKAVELLISCIRNRFDVEMWNELYRFSSYVLKRQDELIYAFMEKHGIELTETNWNAIAKRFQRKRDIYRRTMKRKSKK